MCVVSRFPMACDGRHCLQFERSMDAVLMGFLRRAMRLILLSGCICVLLAAEAAAIPEAAHLQSRQHMQVSCTLSCRHLQGSLSQSPSPI